MTAVAKVAHEHPEAADQLSCGMIAAGHLRPLAYLKPEMAADLLPLARGLSVDEFIRVVARHRVKAESTSLADEQHAERSVTFFEKANGCVRATVVLPPTEGHEFRNMLNELCDQAWRTAHQIGPKPSVVMRTSPAIAALPMRSSSGCEERSPRRASRR